MKNPCIIQQVVKAVQKPSWREGGRAALVLAMRFELCHHQEAISGGGKGLSRAWPGRQVLKWAGELAEPLEGKGRH